MQWQKQNQRCSMFFSALKKSPCEAKTFCWLFLLMKIESVFRNNERIPVKYTADGENVNPSFVISKIPDGAETLALIVEDPDAQRVCGFTWIHWVVFNIPVNSEKVVIKENSIPGIFGKNSFDKKEYDGPSPPKGTGIHHYHFKFYALNTELKLPEMSSLDKIKEKMKEHILDERSIIGIYSKE